MGCQVLILGNRERARHGLRALLQTVSGVGNIKEAEIRENALTLVDESSPDLVLVDGNLSANQALDVIRLVKKHSPSTKVILMAMYGEWESRAKEAGADAFVDKCKSPAELLVSVSKLMSC